MMCTSLINVTIPSTVKSIEDYAFGGCTSLTSITIPSSVISIGEAAFVACTSLTSITIPSGVISIGKQVFGACENLTSAFISSSVTSIGEDAFAECHLDLTIYGVDPSTAKTYADANTIQFSADLHAFPLFEVHESLLTALAAYTEGDYSEANWITLTNFKTNGDAAIDAATDQTGITSALTIAINGMASVPTNVALVATAKSLVTGATYTMTQAAVADESAVKTAIENKIATLALDGVTPVVTKVSYTPAVVGDSGTPAGINGTYTFTVDLSKGTANDETATLTMTILATAMEEPGGSGYTSGDSDSTPSNTGTNIIVGGDSVNAGTTTTTEKDGKTTTTVAIDQQKIEQKLENEGNHVDITIPIITGSDTCVGELNGQLVKSMEDKQATIVIKTDTATYTLPAQQIKIDAVSEQFGKSVELKDIRVTIEISKSAQSTVTIVENSAKAGFFTIVAPPVEFNVSCTYGDKTVNLSQFNNYVERTLAIPAGVDPSKITTAIVVDANGEVRHVPTKVRIIDGKYFAMINSLTNSVYSVIWNPITFSDLVHFGWAKDAINNMGSRLIMPGQEGDLFNPSSSISRAEFAAILVRALGLKDSQGSSVFSDMNTDTQLNSYINTAYYYHLIEGYGHDQFGPNLKITREEALVMIARALQLTGVTNTLSDTEITNVLSAFTDSSSVSRWAKMDVAYCTKEEIVLGKGKNELDPNADITRAEVAVLVERMLKRANLI